MRRPTAGDIGEPVRRIEFEPLPEQAPAEPVRNPLPEQQPETPREPVPA